MATECPIVFSFIFFFFLSHVAKCDLGRKIC